MDIPYHLSCDNGNGTRYVFEEIYEEPLVAL